MIKWGGRSAKKCQLYGEAIFKWHPSNWVTQTIKCVERFNLCTFSVYIFLSNIFPFITNCILNNYADAYSLLDKGKVINTQNVIFEKRSLDTDVFGEFFKTSLS